MESKQSISPFWRKTIQVVFVLTLGVTGAFLIGSSVAKSEKQDLVDRAFVIAKTFHRTPLLNLNGDIGDIKKSDYEYLKKKLVDIKSASPDTQVVYFLGYKKELNKLFFYVDSELPGSNTYSSPGRIYSDNSLELIDNFINATPFARGPYKDLRGSWVSAYAPVLSPDTGLPIAFIAIDITSAHFISKVIYASLFSMLISVFLAIFIIIIYRARLNSKNEEINNIKMEFSSFMSHEIRGYVTKMKGGLKMLFEEDYGKIDQRAQVFVNELFKQSEDFGDLIEEFLDISHIEQDSQISLKMGECNLLDILKSVVADIKDSLSKKDISIVYEGNLPEKIYSNCDSTKVSRVFSNILLNSIKYSKERSAIRVGYLEGNAMHTLYIKDVGIGIPPDEQANVFKKFYRATNARMLHFSGTGLGMYFSKLIIERHGGKIWFESTEGLGTTFFVSLPKDK